MLHEAWHVGVLVAVMAGAAAAILLVVDALVPDLALGRSPRVRRVMQGITAGAALLVIFEWTSIH